MVGCGVLFLNFKPCCHSVLALVCSSDLTVHTGKIIFDLMSVSLDMRLFFLTDYFFLGCFVSLSGKTHFQERNVSKI